MRLSAKSRFAVAAMIDLALREQYGPVPLSAIGQRLRISQSYLEQLFSKLRQQGLVDSTRGPGGGYTLAKAAHLISAADIIRAIDGAQAAQADEPAQAGEVGWQMTRELWTGLSSRMMEHLGSIPLRQLCEEQVAKDVSTDRPTRVARRNGIFAQPKPETPKPTTPNSVFALAGALGTKR